METLLLPDASTVPAVSAGARPRARRRSNRSTRHIVVAIGSVLVVGAGVFTALGGFGRVVVSKEQSFGESTSGMVTISTDLSASSPAIDLSQLLPGRSTQKTLTVRNISSLVLSAINVSATIDGSGAAFLMGANGVKLDVDTCATPWSSTAIASSASSSAIGYTCASTADRDGDSLNDGKAILANATAPFSATLASNVATETSEAGANDVYIRVTARWSESEVVDPNVLPLQAAMHWQIVAIQRTGQER